MATQENKQQTNARQDGHGARAVRVAAVRQPTVLRPTTPVESETGHASAPRDLAKIHTPKVGDKSQPRIAGEALDVRPVRKLRYTAPQALRENQ
jgi:hypothetical protein